MLLSDPFMMLCLVVKKIERSLLQNEFLFCNRSDNPSHRRPWIPEFFTEFTKFCSFVKPLEQPFEPRQGMAVDEIGNG
jgi:hypothetical protein